MSHKFGVEKKVQIKVELDYKREVTPIDLQQNMIIFKPKIKIKL